ncbi:MAG TPA: carbamoyl-phosphate synthase large subunit [Clostridiales bacterium]|nr:carbamoyl-phosphate synthase large subunit [Clostridiales bacterium]
MPRDKDIKKVLVIGSGPIIIGQAAEFDYAGTQACKALTEEGIEVVLINSNPATIMTDTNIAQNIYIEPMVPEVVKNIIKKEKPDSILPTLGGQTGLNLAMELAEDGFLDREGIRLLGTSMAAIKKAEDREAFKTTMESINQPVIESVIARDIEQARRFALSVGFPLVVRPAYTLGGTGGGSVYNMEQLEKVAADGLRASRVHQILLEKSVAGWKEIEYEVIRDSKGNCIAVCNMENFDPVGVHTGDSIVVAPSLTLTTKQCQMLKSASFDIVEELSIEGGCNVQFALHPQRDDYFIIEVNPRLSRSSALASKATGYPIARIATKIAIGYTLDELKNEATGTSFAGFEPKLDYVVTKIPKWPFDKFLMAQKSLGTKMKATGEVMAIGATFEESLLKAVRSLELGHFSLDRQDLKELKDEQLIEGIKSVNDERLFLIAEALRRGMDIDDIHRWTMIDKFFINKIKDIVDLEEEVKACDLDKIDRQLMLRAKKAGFSDGAIAKWHGVPEAKVRAMRKAMGIYPGYGKVRVHVPNTSAISPYFYSSYNLTDKSPAGHTKKVVVLGSGPIRIGQGIEFDYCCVHCAWAARELGYQTIMINNNPETVSTDFDTSDKLYFEPLTLEDVLNIIDVEQPKGVVVQFGGQTAIKLTQGLYKAGVDILGTHPTSINDAEDREEFDKLLSRLNIKRPKGITVTTIQQAVDGAEKLGFPVLVRPSYVLGGQGMEIAHSVEDIKNYMAIVNRIEQEHPVLIDKYLVGKEIEVDAICDGQDILIPGIMEHIERAGVHSGDSISVYPAVSLNQCQREKIEEYTRKIALELKVIGLINIQFVIYNDEVYIIEVNPRSSRTVPYISKVTGVPMVSLATRMVLGHTLKEAGYGTGLYPEKDMFAVKVPVFSMDKLPDTEISLGPEMKSTGEVLGMAPSLPQALFKGLTAAGVKLDGKDRRKILMTVADADKQELVQIAERFSKLGYELVATGGTARVLNFNHIPTSVVPKLKEGSNRIVDMIFSGEIGLVINTPTRGREPQRDGFKIRRTSVESSIPCITSLDTAAVLVQCLEGDMDIENIEPINLRKIGDK